MLRPCRAFSVIGRPLKLIVRFRESTASHCRSIRFGAGTRRYGRRRSYLGAHSSYRRRGIHYLGGTLGLSRSRCYWNSGFLGVTSPATYPAVCVRYDRGDRRNLYRHSGGVLL